VPILSYLNFEPEVGENVSLASDAYVVGKVRISGPAVLGSSAVLRGDQNWIDVAPRFVMGARSSIHLELDVGTQIGSDVWLGEDVVVHGCELGDGVRVEDGGLVLSHARVGAGSIVAADAMVAEGATFEANSYIEGTPGRRVRETTTEEREETRQRVAEAYSRVSRA
jgi:carbonic anhydrase/acetyltransferase-like protein (isoleucine patch superfamily)